MSFQEKYKNLYNFFGAWFPDADFEDLTDEEIVDSFKKVTSNEVIKEALGEISLLVKDESFPLEEITDSTNIHFEDKTDCINWLVNIQTYLKA
ncbi:contact-dependent growth inhibition system immunity protein [Xenorhabdus khoisanae]|uniref:contact-dependent growth inhibition system immunity protein n=1 Tax=Xenorhabdus khoisanae TaxID=880157 RepID=UPI0032B81DB7